MKPNRPITASKELPTLQRIIAIIALILFGSGYCFSQSNKTGQIVDTTINTIQTENEAPVYLDKKDSRYIAIKGRTVTDWRLSSEKSDPKSPENKLIAPQVKVWPQEKQDQLQALFEKSIADYTDQIHLDAETFMLVFSDFGNMDQKKLVDEYDFRVQYLGDNKYAAEFWEDGLTVNSEANALAWATELAKKYPDDKGMIKDVKETYANVRKSIEDGKQDRYTKIMALLYTLEKDGSITFHDPFQPMIDFINR